MDGTIRLWDYTDDVVLKTFKVDKAIHRMEISETTPEYAYIVTSDPEDPMFTTYRYFLGDQDTDKSRLRKIVALEGINALAVSPSGSFVAVGGVDRFVVWASTEGDEDVAEEQVVK